MKKRLEKSEIPLASESNHEAYKLGCVSYEQGRFSEAKALFQEALDFWPEDFDAWWALGNCYDELDKPNKAEDCYRKSLELGNGKNESELLFNLGNSLLDQQRYSEAIEIYLRISSQSDIWSKAQKNMSLAKQGLE